MTDTDGRIAAAEHALDEALMALSAAISREHIWLGERARAHATLRAIVRRNSRDHAPVGLYLAWLDELLRERHPGLFKKGGE